MTKRKSDFTLPTNSLDELFSSQKERDDAKLERVKDIPLTELHPFKDHPFKIQNDDEMKRLMESIQKFGTLTPALARPLPEGGYELISGHRRLAACQMLGIEAMPVIVRKMSDDEAVIAMVDANLQREHIFPSEKGVCLQFVFVDELGERMKPDYLTSQFPAFIQRHGMKKMRFHDLRHSCASLLLANGVPLKQIQDWLGHSDYIYAHLDYSSKLSSAQAMVSGMPLPEAGDFGSRWEQNAEKCGE